MHLIHSCQTWQPDLSSGNQLAQAEQNWPGLGASDWSLAQWARLYGVAALDALADHEGCAHALKIAEDEAHDEGRQVVQDELDELQTKFDDWKAETDDAMREWELAQGCMDAVAHALRQMNQPDLMVLAERLLSRV